MKSALDKCATLIDSLQFGDRTIWVRTATPSQLPNFMYLIEGGLCVPPCLHLPDKPESPIWSVFYSVCMLCQPNGGQALSRSITVRLFLWHYVHLPNNQSLLWNDPSVWGASLALPHDWNDTIKHQRSLLCFNGTFNKTDISSSQQQCLDIEERRGGWVRVPFADRLVAPDK